jgi:hypothetical protein
LFNEEVFDSAYRDFFKARQTVIEASKTKKKKTGKGFSFPKNLNYKTKKKEVTRLKLGVEI